MSWQARPQSGLAACFQCTSVLYHQCTTHTRHVHTLAACFQCTTTVLYHQCTTHTRHVHTPPVLLMCIPLFTFPLSGAVTSHPPLTPLPDMMGTLSTTPPQAEAGECPLLWVAVYFEHVLASYSRICIGPYPLMCGGDM